MTVPHTISAFMESLEDPEQPAFLGFSGGIDSTALLLALREARLPVTAVHFQHGIRGAEAEADARWCQDFCRQREIDFLRVDLQVPRNQRPGETVEEAARRLRLEQWARLAQGRRVYLAHHADDVLEELFLRLARGANASGLTSLRPRRVIHNVTFLRPFLDLTKAQLQDFIEGRGIRDWRMDSTNGQNDYRRNAVRNQLLPLARAIFGTDAGFKQAIWALRQDADHLEEEARMAIGANPRLHDWRRLSPALLPRAFRLWRQKQDGTDEPPARKFIAALQNALADHPGSPRVLQLDPQHLVRLEQDGLRLEQQTDLPPFAYRWDWRQQPRIRIPEAGISLSVTAERQAPETEAAGDVTESFDRDAMPDVLTIRSWRHGDRMVPFGHHGPKKLQDIFTDAHLSHRQKQTAAILCAGDEIAWIPFVRRAEFGRTSPGTSRITIQAKPLEQRDIPDT